MVRGAGISGLKERMRSIASGFQCHPTAPAPRPAARNRGIAHAAGLLDFAGAGVGQFINERDVVGHPSFCGLALHERAEFRFSAD
jgi:hypothetical protein